MRKVSKVYKNNERIGMSKLAVELLKYGIDSPTALKQKFKKCVSFEYDNYERNYIVEALNNINNIETNEPEDDFFMEDHLNSKR